VQWLNNVLTVVNNSTSTIFRISELLREKKKEREVRERRKREKKEKVTTTSVQLLT
jgi:hypothetical protein